MPPDILKDLDINWMAAILSRSPDRLSVEIWVNFIQFENVKVCKILTFQKPSLSLSKYTSF
jgi:hypothetical protein